MSPRHEREAAMDETSDWVVTNRFAAIACGIPDARQPTTLVPAHLANCSVPRRNLCAEFAQLSTEDLLNEAETLVTSLARSGRATDHAIVVALIRKVRGQQPKLTGALWINDLKVSA